jgi:hypothetical protein
MQPLIQFKKITLLFLISLALAWLAAAPTATAQRLINISTRSFVQTGDNVMIAGFIIQGPFSSTVLLRALGPRLGQPPFNVPNALPDPTLTLYNSSGMPVAFNDDWQNTVLGPFITSNQVAAIIATGLAPTFNLESAMIVTLPPGNWTAIVRGFGGLQGNALVEVYD